ncbi:hypothetical protein DY000_02040081 [Brassica cretica]|uniref:Uncharacterized protein n=1 Tax=Brassica cretica TaxID=69181 RepID=A0ABQ7BBI5_BRACR|nr:hypothetical protein DY000_02040081 [Brassica cretica]
MVELEDNLKWIQPRGCNSVDAKLVDAETRGYNSMDGTEWMQQSSNYEADLELNGLGDTQTRTQTDDGPDMTFSAETNQDKDPFCLSKGPVTRSQTKTLKKSIAALFYSETDGNQAKELSQLFTYSVFGLV